MKTLGQFMHCQSHLKNTVANTQLLLSNTLLKLKSSPNIAVLRDMIVNAKSVMATKQFHLSDSKRLLGDSLLALFPRALSSAKTKSDDSTRECGTFYNIAKMGPLARISTGHVANLLSSLPDKLSVTINRITGYHLLQELKDAVDQSSSCYDSASVAFKEAQSNHQLAVDERTGLQKSLHTLLQRKETWSDDEISLFTKLYKEEIKSEARGRAARELVDRTAKEVESSHERLVNAMRERYQSEQCWSDKIRALSTAGTFALMAVNVLLFIYMQFIGEPRKRANLIASLTSPVYSSDEKSTLTLASNHDQPLFSTVYDARLQKIERILLEMQKEHGAKSPSPTDHRHRSQPNGLASVVKGCLLGGAATLAISLLFQSR